MTDDRARALREYRSVLLKHKEAEAKVKRLRQEIKEKEKEYDKTEADLTALQSVGQIIGEVLRQLDDERCERLPGSGAKARRVARLTVVRLRALAGPLPTPRCRLSDAAPAVQ